MTCRAPLGESVPPAFASEASSVPDPCSVFWSASVSVPPPPSRLSVDPLPSAVSSASRPVGGGRAGGAVADVDVDVCPGAQR